MDCQAINFANISKIIVSDDVKYTTFPFVLKMLLEVVQHSFKRHYMYAEGKYKFMPSYDRAVVSPTYY